MMRRMEVVQGRRVLDHLGRQNLSQTFFGSCLCLFFGAIVR